MFKSEKSSFLETEEVLLNFSFNTTYSDGVWKDKYFSIIRNHRSPHVRGKFGEKIIKAYFQDIQNIPYRKIGRGGDGILWESTAKQEEIEVKTATVIFESPTKCKAWSNQIRKDYTQISGYYMVVIHPEKVELYCFKSSDYDLSKLSPGHSGQSGEKSVKQIMLEKDKKHQKLFYERNLGVEVNPIVVWSAKNIKFG